jgi:hypothetical protein
VGQARRVTTTLRATSSVVRELLRLLAVGCAVALGVVGWNLVWAGHQVTMVQVRELEALALLLVVGLLAAGAVPGVRWGAAVAGMVGVTCASVMAFAAADALRVVWDIVTAHTELRQTGLLVTVPAAVVSAVVASALLRASTGGALLPGRPVQSVRPAVLRVIALGAASTVGTSLFVAAAVVVPELLAANQPRSFVAEDVRVTALTLVLSLAVLVAVAVARPARLRRPDAVVLVAAGLVSYPLFLLTSIPLAHTWPPASLMVLLALALAIGVATTVAMARSRRSERRAETVAGR